MWYSAEYADYRYKPGDSMPALQGNFSTQDAFLQAPVEEI